MSDADIDFSKAAKRTGIPQDRLEAIIALDTKLSGGRPLSDCDIQGMLEWAIGNDAFNQALATCASDEELNQYINPYTIPMLRALSYKTRFLDKITKEFDQIYENFKAVQEQGKVLRPKEKISLKQYGILYDIARLNSTLNQLHHMGLINGNEALTSLYEKKEKAAEMIKFFDDTFENKVTSSAGKIVSHSVGRKARLCDSKRSFMDKLVHFLVKFKHTAYGIKSDKAHRKNIQLSHIDPDYRQEQLTFKQALYSEVHELQLENLISDTARETLQAHYGDNWLQIVENKYRTIERRIHDNRMMGYEHIEADVPPLKLFKIFTVWLQGGNRTWFGHHHSNEDVRDKILGQGKWERSAGDEPATLMCSEFVGMTLIASIQMLNDELKQEIDPNGTQALPDLLKSPLSKREKLHLLTPSRLLVALEKRGVVKKIDHLGEELRQYVSTSKKELKHTSKKTKPAPGDEQPDNTSDTNAPKTNPSAH